MSSASASPPGGQYATLHVIGGADRGKSVELTKELTQIGRGLDQDLVLADIAASRRHTTIVIEGSRYRVRDLGSGNGTLLNGVRQDTGLLADGDQIEIGNTLLRFEHPPSRVDGASTPVRDAPIAPVAASGSTAGDYPPPAYGETPSDGVDVAPSISSPPLAPPPQAALTPPSRSLPMPIARRSSAAPLDTPLKQGLVFGSMALVTLLSLVMIVRVGMARTVTAPSEAEELYRQGLRLFKAQDYADAKVNFVEAAVHAPDSADVRRYIHACDLEIKAKEGLKNAERSLGGHRYVEALRALDAIDKASAIYETARRVRRDNAPKAAIESVEEARRLLASDPEAARARAQQALAFDASNSDAAALLGKMKSGDGSSANQNPQGNPPPDRSLHTKRDKDKDKDKEDPDLAPVQVTPVDPKAGAPVGAMSKLVAAAYRARDFSGAERMARGEASSLPPKQAPRALELANSIKALRQAVESSTIEEAKNPSQAVKLLEEATSIDAKLSKGVHAAYFRGKLGKVQLAYAQQTFAQGKFEATYEAVRVAQRYGAGDGGMLKQLELKAAELVQKGQGLVKSNPTQAKAEWRKVIKMVPTSSPNYIAAYKLLNNSAAPSSDEDE